jgi:hypothetical protein
MSHSTYAISRPRTRRRCLGYGSAAESTLVGSSLMSRMLLSMHLACQKAEAASTAINRQLRCFAVKEMQCLLGGQDVTTGDRKRMTTRH